MDELKRCPFCGELPQTKVVIATQGCVENVILFSVVCKKCGTSKGVRLELKTVGNFLEVEHAMEAAVAAWNTRWNDEQK